MCWSSTAAGRYGEIMKLPRLFVMQCNYRIDSRGASRWKVACDRGDQHHHAYRQKHRHDISRRETEEKCGNESTRSDGDTQTGRDTDPDENHGFAHDQAHNVLA